jgi:hypothetical protein
MNIKDIISAVVDSMRPVFPGVTVVANSASPYGITGIERTDFFYIGQKVKFIGTSPVITSICTIISIDNATEIHVSTPDKLTASYKANNSGTLTAILVFDHGHPMEIVNTIQQYTQHDTLKFEVFPRICLFHDFEEKITFEKVVSLNLVIVTDTAPEYSAPQRYTYSFDPILTPLYDLFIRQLAYSPNIQTTEGNNYFKHSKWDRLYWGKDGLYGNTANIFNDFIDAIEINNLEFKIIETC